eukprot:4519264-Ditylum_brightwellii.AAC.1
MALSNTFTGTCSRTKTTQSWTNGSSTRHPQKKKDKTVEVDHAVKANHPDLVLLDRKNKSALLIEVSCPAGANMVEKTADKISKYRDLEIAMKKCVALKK